MGKKTPKQNLRAGCAKSDQQKQKRTSYQCGDVADELHKWDLKVVQVKADGNCFFRAVVDQLQGATGDHMALRQKVVNFIKQHSKDFEPFMEDGETLANHCRRMSEVPFSQKELSVSVGWSHMSEITSKVINASVTRMGHGRDIRSKLLWLACALSPFGSTRQDSLSGQSSQTTLTSQRYILPCPRLAAPHRR